MKNLQGYIENKDIPLLRARYKIAVRKNKKQFVCCNGTWLTSYAKLVLEFYDSTFTKETKNYVKLLQQE